MSAFGKILAQGEGGFAQEAVFEIDVVEWPWQDRETAFCVPEFACLTVGNTGTALVNVVASYGRQ